MEESFYDEGGETLAQAVPSLGTFHVRLEEALSDAI